MLRIRGHHLLCIVGFRGHGYNSAFVENMQRVADAVRGQPELRLTVCEACDDICAACPHTENSACQKHNGSQDSTRKMDRAVLSKIGMRRGETAPVNEVYRRIAGRISVEDISETLCTECEWRSLGFCTEGLRALQNDEFFGATPK